MVVCERQLKEIGLDFTEISRLPSSEIEAKIDQARSMLFEKEFQLNNYTARNLQSVHRESVSLLKLVRDQTDPQRVLEII